MLSKLNYDMFLSETRIVKPDIDANIQYMKSGWEIFSETLVGLTSALAWPIFALAAMLFFGKAIKELISRTKSASIAGNNFNFHDRIQQVMDSLTKAEAKKEEEKEEEKTDDVDSPQNFEKPEDREKKLDSADKTSAQNNNLNSYEKNFINAEHYNRLFRLAEISPKSAVLEAYAYVDYEWAALTERSDLLRYSDSQGWMKLDSYGNNDLLSSAHRQALSSLRELRNSIVHNGDNYSITSLDAKNYIVSAFRLSSLFRDLRSNKSPKTNSSE